MIENYVNLSNKESVFDFYGIDHYSRHLIKSIINPLGFLGFYYVPDCYNHPINFK